MVVEDLSDAAASVQCFSLCSSCSNAADLMADISHCVINQH